jgi:hypothetical protein
MNDPEKQAKYQTPGRPSPADLEQTNNEVFGSVDGDTEPVPVRQKTPLTQRKWFQRLGAATGLSIVGAGLATAAHFIRKENLERPIDVNLTLSHVESNGTAILTDPRRPDFQATVTPEIDTESGEGRLRLVVRENQTEADIGTWFGHQGETSTISSSGPGLALACPQEPGASETSLRSWTQDNPTNPVDTLAARFPVATQNEQIEKPPSASEPAYEPNAPGPPITVQRCEVPQPPAAGNTRPQGMGRSLGSPAD